VAKIYVVLAYKILWNLIVSCSDPLELDNYESSSRISPRKGNTMSKRRTFTPKFKAQVVLEELTGVKDRAEICREHRLRSQVFSR
jgi:hypothetical protein